MRKLKYFVATLFATLMLGTTAFAAEDMQAADMTLYSNNDTVVYSDMNGTVLLSEVAPNLSIHVVGVSNGYFVVDLGDGNTYYIAGNGLSATTTDVTATATQTTATTPATTTKKYTWNPASSDPKYSRYQWAEDMTNEPLYIQLRDELEAQVATGSNYCTASFIKNAGDDLSKKIANNVILDMQVAYPKFEKYSTFSADVISGSYEWGDVHTSVGWTTGIVNDTRVYKITIQLTTKHL